jgi:hypothetical protein
MDRFAKLGVLAAGVVLYSGHPSGVTSHFASLLHEADAPDHCDPELMLEQLVKLTTPLDSGPTQLQIIKYVEKPSSNPVECTSTSTDSPDANANPRAPFPQRCWLLTKRFLVNAARNRWNLFARLVISFVVGLVLAATFHPTDNVSTTRVLLGLYYFGCTTCHLLPFSHLSTFIDARKFFNLERRANLYSTVEYYFATMAVETIVCFLLGLVQVTPVWWLRLSPSFERYCFAVLVFGLVYNIGDALLVLLCNVLLNADMAFAAGAGLNIVEMLYGGYYVPFSEMVDLLAWVRWINPMRFAFEALVINDVEGRTFKCDIPLGCSYNQLDGKGVLSTLGFSDKWHAVFVLVVILLGLHTLSLLALTHLHK